MKDIFIKPVPSVTDYDLINSAKLELNNITEPADSQVSSVDILKTKDNELLSNANLESNQEEFLLRQELALSLKDRITELKEKVMVMRGRLHGTHEDTTIDVQIDKDDKFLMKAIKKTFGRKTDTITSEMYLYAKQQFNNLQQSIVKDVKNE